jgi:release factor glutamine methyltransferase
MPNLLEILQKTTTFLGSKGIENPRLNAELLIGHALGLKRMQLYLQFERMLPEAELEKIRPLVRRRSQREPLQYVLGEVDFAGLHLKVDRRALIPRPETELLLEQIGKRCAAAPLVDVLDLGTGSGALALALASAHPSAQVLALDSSPEALALAQENAVAHQLTERVEFRVSDWFAAVEQDRRFSLIVSNPPYLAAEEVREAAPEVREFEPHGALVAGEDGLADLRRIIAQAPIYLRPGGWLALETGIGQHAALLEQLRAAGLAQVESAQDLTGRDRFVFAQAPA